MNPPPAGKSRDPNPRPGHTKGGAGTGPAGNQDGGAGAGSDSRAG
jgi:hypothetical protein